MPKKAALKGGTKNRRKAAIDCEHLLDIWEARPKGNDCIVGFFQRIPDGLGKFSARSDLVNLLNVLASMAKVSASLNVGYRDLKVLPLLSETSDQKPKSSISTSECPRWVADILVVVQKHMRALVWNQGSEGKLLAKLRLQSKRS